MDRLSTTVGKKRKKYTAAPLSMKQCNTLLTANRYHVLANDADNAEPKLSERPPPIILTDTSHNDIHKAMLTLGITNFSLKVTSIGVRVQTFGDSDCKKLRANLDLNKFEYFSHKSKSDKVFKAVMYGHPQTDINELKECFKTSLNIVPIEVFELKTRGKDPNNAIYLFHFNKKEVSMNDLAKVRVVNHTVIRWAPYSPKFKGPTQCCSCTMYGHGAENCKRHKICMYCASNEHETKDCGLNPSNTSANPIVNGAIFKCFSCHLNKLPSNHSANDPNCPARNNYLSIRRKVNSRDVNNQKRTKSIQPVQSAIGQFVPATQVTPTITFADRIKHNAPTEEENLFSMAELMNIFKDAVTQLKQCRTRIDQIQVIASLLEHAVK